MPLFGGITSDLFPGIELPTPDYEKLLEAVHTLVAQHGLQPVPAFIAKVHTHTFASPHTPWHPVTSLHPHTLTQHAHTSPAHTPSTPYPPYPPLASARCSSCTR